MKQNITMLLLCISLSGFSQAQTEVDVKNTILSFFEGFHNQDSLLIKSHVSEAVILKTIGKNTAGEFIVNTGSFNNFLKSIVSIPKDQKFEEKLLDFTIQIDGPMAHVWTPYEFWLNGKFSHCGVNSFQLLKEKDTWKIMYLIDTRRQTDCNLND